MRGPKSLDSQEFSRLNVLNSCESSCRGGTLNDENVIIRYTTLFAWIWLIFGAIQLRYPNVPSPPAPLPKERGVFKQFLSVSAGFVHCPVRGIQDRLRDPRFQALPGNACSEKRIRFTTGEASPAPVHITDVQNFSNSGHNCCSRQGGPSGNFGTRMMRLINRAP